MLLSRKIEKSAKPDPNENARTYRIQAEAKTPEAKEKLETLFSSSVMRIDVDIRQIPGVMYHGGIYLSRFNSRTRHTFSLWAKNNPAEFDRLSIDDKWQTDIKPALLPHIAQEILLRRQKILIPYIALVTQITLLPTDMAILLFSYYLPDNGYLENMTATCAPAKKLK